MESFGSANARGLNRSATAAWALKMCMWAVQNSKPLNCLDKKVIPRVSPCPNKSNIGSMSRCYSQIVKIVNRRLPGYPFPQRNVKLQKGEEFPTATLACHWSIFAFLYCCQFYECDHTKQAARWWSSVSRSLGKPCTVASNNSNP